ncbi:MAG: SIR2 family protein [Phycisphaerales bacterium]
MTHLVEPYSGCRAGTDLSPLSTYLWLRAFTFNIDDVIEDLYTTAEDAKQKLVSLNYDRDLEPTPIRSDLQLIHLHGSVKHPSSSFVFSHADYARVMRSLNSWMHILSETLSTEPFIIAGTSLSEVDLEYYLTKRTAATPKRGAGPSLLIDPDPDAITESDCKRHGLHLVKAKFGDFLTWMREAFPSPPTVGDLIVPATNKLFPDTLSPLSLVKFFSDFRLVIAGKLQRSVLPTPFLYGGALSDEDLHRHVDIARADIGPLQDHVEQLLRHPAATRMITLLDDAGTGKSAFLRRVAHELAALGIPVLEVRALERIDVDSAIDCFAAAKASIVLVVDNLGTHAEQIAEILSDPEASMKVVVLASDRNYRREYLDTLFPGNTAGIRTLTPFTIGEYGQLIELYRSVGLVGTADATKNPKEFVAALKGDPVAVAACRIMNNYQPLEKIIDSMWRESPEAIRLPYLTAALARQCDARGIRYSILQAVSGSGNSVSDLFTPNVSLRLIDHPSNAQYSLPLNTTVAESMLRSRARERDPLVYEAFSRLASELAPHVNRNAIKRRTPEAGLAGRLFDVDTIVKPLLGPRTEEWYLLCQEQWQWNSRYWEQRALFAATTDLDLALGHARHALAIEVHPYTLTTLGKILLRIDERDGYSSDAVFDEAFSRLEQAISGERARSRIRIHPYVTLFGGALRRLGADAVLSSSQIQGLRELLPVAAGRFGNDPVLRNQIAELSRLL